MSPKPHPDFQQNEHTLERPAATTTLIFHTVCTLMLKLYINYGRRRLRFAFKIAAGSLSGGGSLSGPYLYAIRWKYVSHENVLPFLGISEALPPFGLVSPRMQDMNILEYIKENQGTERLTLVRVSRNQRNKIKRRLTPSSTAGGRCLWY